MLNFLLVVGTTLNVAIIGGLLLFGKIHWNDKVIYTGPLYKD